MGMLFAFDKNCKNARTKTIIASVSTGTLFTNIITNFQKCWIMKNTNMISPNGIKVTLVTQEEFYLHNIMYLIYYGLQLESLDYGIGLCMHLRVMVLKACIHYKSSLFFFYKQCIVSDFQMLLIHED